MIKLAPETAVRFLELAGMTLRQSTKDRLLFRVKTCPRCDPGPGHSEFALRFHAGSQWFRCYRECGSFTLLDYARDYFGLTSQVQTLREISKVVGGVTFLPLNFDAVSDLAVPSVSIVNTVQTLMAGTIENESAEASDFTLGFHSEPSGPVGAAIFDYLRTRNVPEWFLALKRCGYYPAESGPWSSVFAGRLCFLVYEDGRPVFCFGRAVRSGVEPKYKYPTADQVGGSVAQDFVFNLDLQPLGADLLIAEGAISALSAGAQGIAILGNVVSQLQAYKIAQKKPSSLILLREPGISMSHALESVAALRLYNGCPIMIATFTDGDANSRPDLLAPALEDAAQLRGLEAEISALLE